MEVICSEKHCRTTEVVKMGKMCVYVLRGSACISVCTCENAEVQFSVCLGECLLQVFHLWVKLIRLTIQARRWQDLILFSYSFFNPDSLPHTTNSLLLSSFRPSILFPFHPSFTSSICPLFFFFALFSFMRSVDLQQIAKHYCRVCANVCQCVSVILGGYPSICGL